jgi:hypothetical protein
MCSQQRALRRAAYPSNDASKCFSRTLHFLRKVNFGKLDLWQTVVRVVLSQQQCIAKVMARTKVTARPSSGGLWLARVRYGHYLKEKRRALRYLRGFSGGAKAACYSAEAAFSQVGELHRNPVVLQEVCRYLVGHSLYVSLVCKSWKDCYEIAAAQTEPTFAVVPDDDDDGDDSDVDCTQADIAKEKVVGSANITLYQAAFASAATAVWAYENDLDLNDDAVTRSAGKYGSLEALAQIYKLDGTWDGALTNGAAARGMYDVTYLQKNISFIFACAVRHCCQDVA